MPEAIYLVLITLTAIFVSSLALVTLFKSKAWVERILPTLVLSAVASVAVGLVFPKQPQSAIPWVVLKRADLKEIKESLKPGQPALIEFTADWCINCKVLENLVYSNRTVQTSLADSNITPIQFDMTEFTPEVKEALTHYGGQALPYAVLLDQQSEVASTLEGMFTSQALLDAIASLKRPQELAASLSEWGPKEGDELIGSSAPGWQESSNLDR